MSANLPFAKISFSKAEETAVLKCMRSGWITTGPLVSEFEKAFATFVGTEEAVSFSSGTAALHMALNMLDLKKGDEVITPAMTWVSVPNLILILGAKPVFCDIDPKTLNMDLDHVESLITEKTRAVVPVHFAGRPVEINRLKKMSKKYNFSIIEDGCHAVGAEYDRQKIGSHSELCAFSFHPNKNITTIEGGMLTGLNTEKLRKAKLLRFHGLTRDSHARNRSNHLVLYDSLFPGYKLNMTDVSAAIGLCQLKKVNKFNKKREALVDYYRELLADISDKISIPGKEQRPSSLHSWHLLTAIVSDEENLRERIVGHLNSRNIHTGLHYLPAHLMSGIKKRVGKIHLPVTERIGRTIFSLPLFPDMSMAQVRRVCNELRNSIKA